jgi:branched-chain amino acid transport system ATP-binding protein
MNMHLLEIKNLQAGYEKIPVLHGTSAYVDSGEIVSLVGPNGAGKTTLLRTISGLMHPTSGEILFNGEPIHHLEPHHIVAKGIMQVPEGRQLFGMMTVGENLRVGAQTTEARKKSQETKDLVLELFPALRERLDQLAATLSGGEQQMLATARALMGMPKLLMMDEPSWGVAPLLVDRLFSACAEINKQGCTILLIEQNVQKALSLAYRGYVLERGNVVMEGPSKALLADPRLKESYLGL